MSLPKTILIIGATSGIGYALAEAYLQAGWRVAATGRRYELLQQLQRLQPDRVHIRQHDVTAANSLALLEELLAESGPADVVVYNSGVGLANKKLDFDIDKKTIDVNVVGFVEVATWAYQYFRERSGGQFVGVSSIASLRGGRAAPAYHASKAFISNYMEGMRQKARHHRMPFYVTDIRPGYVHTPMTEKNAGMYWVAPSDKAARQIMAAIERKARVAYITKRWALVALAFRLIPRGWHERQ
ncbi:MAG: SDR family NAD(P)-dependent oxidoreductase [Saprospiraceae bacterium]|nr:SDR family NAD(P)-dependent oxidoreductase [Saprospiraceae bacterium]